MEHVGTARMRRRRLQLQLRVVARKRRGGSAEINTEGEETGETRFRKRINNSWDCFRQLRKSLRMPPKPGKKTLLARETGEGSSQQTREVGGEGADGSTGSEEEEEGDSAEVEKEKNREARKRMDERDKRLKEKEEALRREQRDHHERVRRSISRRARRE